MPVLTSRLLREPSVAGFPTLTGIPLRVVRLWIEMFNSGGRWPSSALPTGTASSSRASRSSAPSMGCGTRCWTPEPGITLRFITCQATAPISIPSKGFGYISKPTASLKVPSNSLSGFAAR
jgi:hypothetical protein